MGGDSWRPYKPSQPSSGCFLFQRLIPYSGSGNKITCLQTREGLGFLMKIGSPQRNSTILLTTWMLSAGAKRSTHWIGYKVHFSETCDEDLPRLITQVTTTIAPIPDRHALPEAHAILEQRELLPEQHLVDAGYIDAEGLVASQADYQVDLIGPTAKDYRWQAREHNGYALTDFSIDWEHEQARCPQGQISSSWTPTWTRNQEIIKIKFGFATCGACPVHSQCTKAKQRSLSVRRQEAHFALEAARQREQTEEFKQAYAK